MKPSLAIVIAGFIQLALGFKSGVIATMFLTPLLRECSLPLV